ncbi:MAG: NAD-dependent epimerase/dehydratase family protein [Nitrososphaerota archaeon]
MSKKALVLGGAGFIGSAISKGLLRKGYEVTIVDNLETGNLRLLPKEGYDFINLDVTSSEFLEKTKGIDFDYIFNFGSYSSDRFFNFDGDAVYKTIKGMLNVIKLAESSSCRSVVYPSSGTVYGNSKPPQKEVDNVKPKSMYACTKLFLENFTSTLSDGINYVGLRIFTGYGEGEIFKGDMASVVTLFFKSIKRGEKVVIYGDGTQKRDFVYVEDIADIAIKAAEKEVSGVLNVGSGQSTSFNDLIKMLSEALNTNAKVVYIKSPIPWIQETKADITKLKKFMNYSPTPLSEGIVKLISGVSKLDESWV